MKKATVKQQRIASLTNASVKLLEVIERIKAAEALLPEKQKGNRMYNVEYRKSVVQLVYFFGIRGAAAFTMASPSSVCRWAKNIYQKIYKKRLSCITDDVIVAIRCFLKNNCVARVKDVKEFVSLTFEHIVSRQLIQTVLAQIGITFKRTQTRARKREPGHEYNSRVSRFCRLYTNKLSSSQLIVSIDESAIDERSRPEYGYADIGEKAILFNPPVMKMKIKKQTLLMAIATDDSKIYSLYNHAVDSNSFADFILQLPYPPNTTIIMDNLGAHDVLNVQVAMEVKGYTPLFTPPQSPEFNPIEMVFGAVKNKFKIYRYNPEFTTIADAVDNLVASSTSNREIPNYFEHVLTYISTLFIIDELDCLNTVNSDPLRKWNGRKLMQPI
jgi:transposase